MNWLFRRKNKEDPNEPVPPYTPPYNADLVIPGSSSTSSVNMAEEDGQRGAVADADVYDREMLETAMRMSREEAEEETRRRERENLELDAIQRMRFRENVEEMTRLRREREREEAEVVVEMARRRESEESEVFVGAAAAAEGHTEITGLDASSQPLRHTETVTSSASSTELLTPAARRFRDLIDPEVKLWRARQRERDAITTSLARSAKQIKRLEGGERIQAMRDRVVLLEKERTNRMATEEAALHAGAFAMDELAKFDAVVQVSGDGGSSSSSAMDAIVAEQMKDMANLWFLEGEKDNVRVEEIGQELRVLQEKVVALTREIEAVNSTKAATT
ncbi:hypothetical protein HK101_011142, partial [Irineochytrium annulatum]